jgi:hypothetical protein
MTINVGRKKCPGPKCGSRHTRLRSFNDRTLGNCLTCGLTWIEERESGPEELICRVQGAVFCK